MRRQSTVATVILVVIVVLVAAMYGPYNRMVALRNQVNEQAAQIENVLQGRLEKIPDLVASAKAFMKHEETIFTTVAEARGNLQSAIDSGDMGKMADANEEFNLAMTSFTAVVEAYPELSSNQLFVGLQDEIAGSVNRIQQERRTYNQLVTKYNTKLETFPTMLYARLFGFKPAEYFQATEEAHKTNVVDFGD